MTFMGSLKSQLNGKRQPLRKRMKNGTVVDNSEREHLEKILPHLSISVTSEMRPPRLLGFTISYGA